MFYEACHCCCIFMSLIPKSHNTQKACVCWCAEQQRKLIYLISLDVFAIKKWCVNHTLEYSRSLSDDLDVSRPIRFFVYHDREDLCPKLIVFCLTLVVCFWSSSWFCNWEFWLVASGFWYAWKKTGLSLHSLHENNDRRTSEHGVYDWWGDEMRDSIGIFREFWSGCTKWIEEWGIRLSCLV